MKDDQDLVVTFTLQYGREVHSSPKLFDVVELKGNWLAVIMELVEGERVEDDEEKPMCQKFYKEVVLPKLMKKGYVHGDLRLANVMRRNGKYMLLDYDWAGKSGEVHFPLNLNYDLNWP